MLGAYQNTRRRCTSVLTLFDANVPAPLAGTVGFLMVSGQEEASPITNMLNGNGPLVEYCYTVWRNFSGIFYLLAKTRV